MPDDVIFWLKVFSGRLFETAYVKREYVINNNNIQIYIIYYITFLC
jgi:hypothetical protein